MSPLSLHRKLVLGIMLTAGLALLMALGAFLAIEVTASRESVQRELAVLADVLGEGATASLDFRDVQESERLLASLRFQRPIEMAVLFDRNALPFAHYRREGIPQSLLPQSPPKAGRAFEDGGYRLSHPIVRQGEFLGTLYIRSDLSYVYARMRWGLLVGFSLTLLIAGAALIFSLRVGRVVADPILRLVDAARRVAEHGDFGNRVVRESQDEVGLLVDAFNRMLDELRVRQSRLLEAQQMAHLGNWILDPSTHQVECSEEVFRVCGVDQLPTTTDAFRSLIHPEDLSKVQSALQAVLSKGEPLSLDHRLCLPDGSIRWVHSTAATFRDDAGGLVLRGTIMDITDRKQAELALRASEHRLNDILNSVDAYIFIKDRHFRFTYVNRKVCELFGLPAEEIVGKDDSVFFSGTSLAEIQQHDRRVVEKGETIALQETNLKAADGSPRTFWSVKVPLRDQEGSIYGLCGTSTDITARKLAEDEREQLQAQLQQASKMESLGSLAGGVAHDMNNVLGAILGMAELGIEDQPKDSQGYRSLDTIMRAAERGGKMVKSLLRFARQSPAELQELELNAILREEVHLLERTTLAKVRLDLDLADDLRPIRGDASALTHAFMNLCVNSVDAMPEAGTLTLRTRNVDNHWIEVVVEDTGTGMPKEVLDKALDPFFTTKGIGKGTGLGLSLVYSTVKSHQGQMEIQSEPGVGTRVRMRFPSCNILVPAQEPSDEPLPTCVQRPQELLLVDDDDILRGALAAVCQKLGHRVTAVPSGEEALALLEAGVRPDWVLLDMNMPGLGGSGTLPRLRSLCPNVPVLLVTGRADQAAIDLVGAHPGVTLLSKPFSMKVLQQHLDSLGGTG
ncbi:MAG: PAS domain S-box protein [Geothrix sp.]|nr:PAS domain S-box protein [Geothrix sp.]